MPFMPGTLPPRTWGVPYNPRFPEGQSPGPNTTGWISGSGSQVPDEPTWHEALRIGFGVACSCALNCQGVACSSTQQDAKAFKPLCNPTNQFEILPFHALNMSPQTTPARPAHAQPILHSSSPRCRHRGGDCVAPQWCLHASPDTNRFYRQFSWLRLLTQCTN